MVKELELFGLDGASGWFSRTKKEFHLEPGQTCRNCATELQGRFCHVCSQDADTHHRTLFHLIFEGFEGLFHLDGRLWQSLPPLFFNPGALNRDFIEGRIARHVPPFRMFLVALLVFMFAAEHKAEELQHKAKGHGAAAHSEQAQAPDHVAIVSADMRTGAHSNVTTKTHADGTVETTRNINVFAMSDDDAKYLGELVGNSGMKPEWLKARITRALQHPEGFVHAMFTWGHRLALLLLPIIGLVLGLLYIGKKHKRFFLYDHLLVAMNLLSFIFFLNAIRFVLPEAAAPWAGMIVLGWTLITFFRTLRGAFGSSIVGAALKSLILAVMTAFSFAIVLVGVMYVSLTAG